MRVVLLGGAGEIGAEIAVDLAAVAEIDALVIADLDEQRAATLAREIGRPHVVARQVDVHDREAALALLGDANLVMNCTTLTLFEPVFELALEASVDYADLISEPTPEQRQAAAWAGITAISGLGVTPGLSNVLVRHAAEELDELYDVNISWISLRSVAPSPGLLDTILWEVSEDCPTRRYFKDGRHHRASFLEGSRLVRFAAPVGRQFVYYVPHPEVMTLPAHFPTLRGCAVRGSWRPDLMQDMRVLERYGLLEPATLQSTKRAIWDRLGGDRDSAPWMLYAQVEVEGRREEDLIRRTYDISHPAQWGAHGGARVTALPAAVGAQLLARHGRTTTGFIDPEEYYDPFEFLEELGRRSGIAVTREEEVLVGTEKERTRA